MREYLLSKIAEREAKIREIEIEASRLDQEKMVAVAEMGAYEDALAQLPESEPEKTYTRRDAKKHGRTGVRSGNWKGIFEYIARNWPNVVTNDEMMSHAGSAGLTLSRQALRAQLSTYTAKGALERVGDGVYRITQLGASELGIHLEEMREPGHPDLKAENVIAPPATATPSAVLPVAEAVRIATYSPTLRDSVSSFAIAPPGGILFKPEIARANEALTEKPASVSNVGEPPIGPGSVARSGSTVQPRSRDPM
jgi:hypothetical protein